MSLLFEEYHTCFKTASQLNAVASVPGTFVYTPAAGTVLDVGTRTLHVDFTPSDSATYNTASADVQINVLEQPVVPLADFSASSTTGKAPLTVTFRGYPKTNFIPK